MLDQLQRKLRECRAEVRWVATPSIHLTLKFLGEADPEVITKLSESLHVAAKPENSLKLLLKGLGCFPNHKNPRVIWCGIGGDTSGLLHLQQKVEAAARALGFSSEHRPFHPHLTLGRAKGKRNLQPLLDCIKMGSDLECSFKVDSFNIYRSTLKPQGAVYTVIETIRLGYDNTAIQQD